MSKTLTEMVCSAESEGCDASKNHLDPAHEWHNLSDNSVGYNHVSANSAMESSLNVKFEVYAQNYLHNEHEHKRVGKRSMDVRGELASLVKVAKKVREDGHSGTNDLNRNMVSRPDDLDVSKNVSTVKITRV